MAKNYNTRTASLKATIADVRVLDAKEMSLNGKNILDYISDSEFDSYDTRDPQLKNDDLDIWNTSISLSEEGHIEVKPDEHTYEEMTDEQKELLLNSAAKVIDNEVLDTNGNHLMYWQTDGLTNAFYMADKDNDGENDADLSVFCHYDYSDGGLSNLNLTTFSSDLSSLTNGNCMFYECYNLTSFSSDLSKLTNSREMFYGCSQFTTFTSDLSSLTDSEYMFDGCTKLASFNSDLSKLTYGLRMFAECRNLTSFSSDLSSLTDGCDMFVGCTNLTSFSSDLSSLTGGSYMFSVCTNLTSFSSDLSSLTYCEGMFYDCFKLTTFSSDLPSLTYGAVMFYDCENLTSFSSDLSSLENGNGMFEFCKLDAQSVANIVHTLPTRETSGEITIGVGCDNTEVDQLLFAQECDCETWQELLDDFSAKNWTVTFQCNGRPTTTYNMRRGETLPIYAKLVEVIMPTDENERKPHYAYTSQDGSKFYNINYFHSTNGSTEGYDVFSSLEEAISSYNVTPKN